jgi:hypothetical protein
VGYPVTDELQGMYKESIEFLFSWVFTESGIPEPKPHTMTRMNWICKNTSNYKRNVLNPTVMESG